MLASGCSALALSDSSRHPTSEPTCSTSQLPVVADGTVAVIAGAMSAAVLSVADDAERDPTAFIVTSGAVSAVFLASAIVGAGRVNRCKESQLAWRTRPAPVREAPVPFAPFVEHVPAKDPEAARLTREAHAAATEQRCAPTAAHGPRVRYLDPEYYDKVFLVDDAIARCR